MARKIDYIYQRPGSKNWWVKIQYPADIREDGMIPAMVRMSLGTEIKAEAEVLALKELYAAKLLIIRLRGSLHPNSRITNELEYAQTPDSRIDNDDGTWTTATDTHIMTYDTAGVVFKVVNNTVIEREVHYVAMTEQAKAELGDLRAKVGSKARERDIDEEMAQFWIEKKKPSRAVLADYRRFYAMFQTLCPGKTLTNAMPEDAAILADHLFDSGLKSRTVKKAVGQLSAVVNAALTRPGKFSKLKGNPFSRAVELLDDMEDRLPFNDDEMALMKANMHKLDPDERLLWVLCATTGMRRSEAWQILGEQTFDGIRCVQIGRKKRASDRIIPLPEAALPYLPEKITGTLFDDSDPVNVGKNLLRFIRRMGIKDPKKVLHSTRHRASTRMASVGDPSIRDAVLGHDDQGGHGKQTARKIYFHGHPVPVIAAAINLIGM